MIRLIIRGVISFILISSSTILAQDKNLNVLFIAIDDLKPLLGSYGYSQMHTPQMDDLAKEGFIFTNAHCQQAVCGPTRASLMTGMRPDYTGVWDLRTRMRHINPDIMAMPEYFKENGYSTVAIGKIYDPRCVDLSYDLPSWSVPYKESSTYIYPEAYGEPGLSFYASKEAKEIISRLEAEAKENDISGVHNYIAERYKPSTERADVPDEAYMDGQICNNALNYLDAFSKQDKPFFLAVGFKRPHLPFAAPEKYWQLYDENEIELASYQKPVKDGVRIAYHNHGELQSYSDIPVLESFSDIFSELLPEEKQRELIHGYYASVSFIDAQVGKLMKKLDELGLKENTVVILWGDHGWHLGDHALWCKHSNFEQATRVPLMVSLPSGESGVYDHPVEFVDIFPTLCDATGLETPSHLQGLSLVPAMKDPSVTIKEYAVSQFDRGKNHGYSIRTDRYRLTIWIKDDYRTFKPFSQSMIFDCEVYDYLEDPDETVNLYRSVAHKEVVDHLMSLFTDFVKQQNIALKNAGSNPENRVSAGLRELILDEGFDKPLGTAWRTFARNNSSVEFDILSGSPIGNNTMQVNVLKTGENPWDIGIQSTEATALKAGDNVYLSLSARGKQIKVVLLSDQNESLSQTIEPGQSTFLQNMNFKIPADGMYTLKFHFLNEGIYLLDNIKTEIE